MTSKWPASFATYPVNGGFGDRVTVTELLHKAGYATCHFGKWHIGPEDKLTPGTYGIDVISGGLAETKKKNETRGRDAPIFDEAIQFIEQHKDGPFYVNVWGHVSHHKVDPPQIYVDQFKNVIVDESKFAEPMQEKFAACKARGGDVSDHMRRYLADSYSLDEDIGRLLKRVEELGLHDQTIVVFSSDQGPAPLHGSSEDEPMKKRNKNKTASADDPDVVRLNAMGYADIHRGGKHGMYEGGVRVPFIVRWPGHVPAQRVDDQSALSGADWLPTLCSIADVRIRAADFDGEDVSAAWLGKGEHFRRKPLFWKTSPPGSSAGIREAQWKLIHPTRKNGGELELYDIANDPGEKHNLADKHPNVVKTLSAKVDAWVATLPKTYFKSDDKN